MKNKLIFVAIVIVLLSLIGSCVGEDDDDCGMCGGSGYYEQKTCPACSGSGSSNYDPYEKYEEMYED